MDNDKNELLFEILVTAREELEKAKREQEELIESVLTDKQKREIREIREEYEGIIKSIEQTSIQVEEKLREKVLKKGETICYGPHKAIYTNGRITWDTKAMEGLRTQIPLLNEYRKEGDPYVVIKFGKE